MALTFQNQIANVIDIQAEYIYLVIWILLLDTLVIIPFAWLRTRAKPIKYATRAKSELMRIENDTDYVERAEQLHAYISQMSAQRQTSKSGQQVIE